MLLKVDGISLPFRNGIFIRMRGEAGNELNYKFFKIIHFKGPVI